MIGSFVELVNSISFLMVFRATQLRMICSSATGSSPKPFNSYSKTSLVIGLERVSFASPSSTHLGLKVTGKYPVVFLLIRKSFWLVIVNKELFFKPS